MTLPLRDAPPVLADRLYALLTGRGVDCAPLGELASALDTGEAELRLVAGATPYLGLCQDAVYCLPPQPRAAGFEVRRDAGRLWLRLPRRGLRPPLLVGGQHVGRVPRAERATTLGAGQLAYAVCRLTLMALDWMPPVDDPTRYLFELIAEAWRNGATRRVGAGLMVHRASFTQPVAAVPVTNRLELVTNRRRREHLLVNVYPGVTT